jgi:hypothetical protein
MHVMSLGLVITTSHTQIRDTNHGAYKYYEEISHITRNKKNNNTLKGG